MAENSGHEPHKIGSKLSDVILGGQDGLVSIIGLLLGLTAATSSTRIVIAGGLATIFAETLSMGAVAYTSKMAERDHYAAERKREKREIKEMPDQEAQEIRDIYAGKGFDGPLLEEIVQHITADETLWLDTMMRDELNLLPVVKHDVYVYSFTVGVSTFVGAILPLIPFFLWPVHIALVIALIISVATLAGVGLYQAHATETNPVKSALQMVLIGMGAALAGYVIGLLFKAR